MRRGSWMGICMLCTVACGDPEMLGETDCEMNQADCGGVPLYDSSRLDSSSFGHFDLEGGARVAAAWTAPLVLMQEQGVSFDPYVHVEPAPEGGVWVIQPRESARNLLRFDDAGREIAAVPTPMSFSKEVYSGTLSVSPALQPVVDLMMVGDETDPLPHRAYFFRQGAGPTAMDRKITDLKPLITIAGPGDTLRSLTLSRDGHLTVHESRSRARFVGRRRCRIRRGLPLARTSKRWWCQSNSCAQRAERA